MTPCSRVVPAQQRLHAEDDAAAHVHLRLVVQHELVVVERLLHAADRHHPFFGAAAVLGVEDEVAVAARLLGAIHRVVGVAQQRVRVAAVQRVDGGADAGRDLYRVGRRVDGIGHGDHAQHALDGQAGLLQGARAKQEHELVAAEAGRHVRPRAAAAQRAAQALREFHEQAVARGMAVAVVDGLEVVEVEVAHGQQVTLALGGRHGLRQELGHAHAVRQARELVEVGLALEAFALQPLFRDVGDHEHVVERLLVGPADCGDGDVQRAGIAVSAAVDDLAAPGARGTQAGPHRGLLDVAGGDRSWKARAVPGPCPSLPCERGR